MTLLHVTEVLNNVKNGNSFKFILSRFILDHSDFFKKLFEDLTERGRREASYSIILSYRTLMWESTL